MNPVKHETVKNGSNQSIEIGIDDAASWVDKVDPQQVIWMILVACPILIFSSLPVGMNL